MPPKLSGGVFSSAIECCWLILHLCKVLLRLLRATHRESTWSPVESPTISATNSNGDGTSKVIRGKAVPSQPSVNTQQSTNSQLLVALSWGVGLGVAAYSSCFSTKPDRQPHGRCPANRLEATNLASSIPGLLQLELHQRNMPPLLQTTYTT